MFTDIQIICNNRNENLTYQDIFLPDVEKVILGVDSFALKLTMTVEKLINNRTIVRLMQTEYIKRFDVIMKTSTAA